MTDIRLLIPAVAAWAAVALLLDQSVVGVAIAVAGVLLAAAGTLVVARRRQRPRRWWLLVPSPLARSWILALVGIALALGALLMHRGIREAGTVGELADQRAVVTVVGTIASDPRLVGNGAESQQKAMLRLRVDTITGRGRVTQVDTPVLVFADRSWLSTTWGQRVQVTGRLDQAVPGDEVQAILGAPGPAKVVDSAGPVTRAAEHVRASLREAVSSLPADARGLVPGLVIGDTSLTPPSLTEAMRATSLTHLSAVSGTNVSIVLACLIGAAGLVGLGRRWRPLIAAAGLAAFVVLARPEPSVVRAAAMGAVGLLGLSTRRRSEAVPALAAAVLGLLVYDPWLARSMGFALSTLATLGLLLFARPWGAVIARFLPARLEPLGPALAVPVAAQVMCAPVMVLLQPSVSLVGIPANLLAAPLVTPATLAGVATALVAVVVPPVAPVVAWGAGVPGVGIAAIARVGARVPFGSVPWPEGALGAWLLAVLTLVLVLTGPRLVWLARLRPWVAVGVVLVLLASTVTTTRFAWPPPGWRLVMCDIGQGDGLVLASGDGHGVLVDTGPDPPLIRECLSRLGIHVLDAVILTHYHADHVDGLRGVLESVDVRTLLVDPVPLPDDRYRDVVEMAADRGIVPAPIYAGDHLVYGDVQAEVLWPRRRIEEASVPNNNSIVLLVTVAGLRVLMLADVEVPSAHQVLLELRQRPADEVVDVLKVAHHGSAKQDQTLLSELRAPLALISVGRDNSYGHPAPSTLKALARGGYRVLRSDQDGDVAVLGSGASLEVARRGP